MPHLFDPDYFRGKHVFIAGGTTGINQGIGHGFARMGANISTCSRKAENVEAAIAGFKSEGVDAIGATADVRDYEQVAYALKTAVQSLGPIDVLISGAAGNFVVPALGMSANAFKTVMDIDLQGTFNVFRAGHEHLNTDSPSGASCIAISAPQGLIPYGLQSHVCAAKAGVEMLAQCLAVEWGPLNVRVNTIVPGPIADTEGMRRLSTDEVRKKDAGMGLPIQRYGTKQEIADACIFLSSPAAAYITGISLPVDGGCLLMGAGRMQESLNAAFEASKQASNQAGS